MNSFRGYRFARWLGFALKTILRSLAVKAPLKVFGTQEGAEADCIESVYIINLDRQPSRWENFRREARRLVVEGGGLLLGFCHRVSAVDSKLLDANEANESVSPTYPLDAQYYVDPDPRLLTLIRDKAIHVSMSREEIAVALSHINVWSRVVAENRSYALILEDDVYFEMGFAAQLNRSWRELPKKHDKPRFDLLYLSFREVERGAQSVAFSPNLLRLIRGYWWLSGYVLSNAGARKLLELLPVTGPVDLWMNHRFADLDVYSTPTSVISQRTDLQSDNRYSILPLLSQIGVQTDRTHLILEQTRGRRPVFCVGFGREEAAILESALSLLGYRCCNDRWGLFSANVGQLLDENRPLLFDAYIRVESVSRQVARVQGMYPDAAFLVPPAEQEGGDFPSEEEYLAVRARLRGKGDNLLAFDVRDPSGWRNLCTFLRCNRPSHPFPANGLSNDAPILLSGAVRHTPVAARCFIVQEHDVHPWIVPYERMAAFGVLREVRTHGTQAGVFKSVAADDFSSFDESRWTALEDSFPSNLARFRRENIEFLHPHGCRMSLEARIVGDRTYAAGSLTSKQSYRYGRFEVIMKVARAPGVVTAFFLHRTDPWQEIDIELLGSDTTKALVNVFYNPGDPGAKCNFGNRGTPTVIDLTFDAAEDYHRYAVEWEPHEVRWFVDDQLIHVRATWEPTPIPNLPMGVYCSIWASQSAELAGTLRPSDLPASSALRRIELWEWSAGPPPLAVSRDVNIH